MSSGESRESQEPLSINPALSLSEARVPIATWIFVILNIALIAATAILLDKPSGAISGRVAIEEPGFNLHTYDMRKNRAYVLVTGPRKGPMIDRGAWVDRDGRFKIDQLPVGEYTLKLRAPGFSTAYSNGIFVEDAKTSEIAKPIELSILNPTINIASNSRVFTTKEPPHFWINATGATSAEVTIYKKDLLAVLNTAKAKNMGLTLSADFGIYVNSGNSFDDPFSATEKPVQKFSRHLVMDDSDSANAQFKFDRPLEPGDYFAVAKVSDLTGKHQTSAMTWFSVSDIGLILKNTPDRTVVKALDLNTLKAQPGVDLKLFTRTDDTLSAAIGAAVTTGADGMATIMLPRALAGQLSYEPVVVGNMGANKAYSGQSYSRGDSDLHRTYFYTDRPVYRLGQTVYFKGICRSVDGRGIFNKGAGEQLEVVVEDPDNNELSSMTLKTNEHGSFHGLIQVPADGKTGAYQVQIKYPDGSTSYHGFEIAQYRKPEYQVEVLPVNDHIIAGQTAKARIHATYFFGGPVANARVSYKVYSSTDWNTRWRLMDRPEFYSFFDDWSDVDYSGGGGDYITEGYAVTDANGDANVEFATSLPVSNTSGPPGSDYNDKKLRIEAEVTDISRLTVVGSGTLSMTAGDAMLLVTPSNYVVESGSPMAVDLQAINYQGKPVANQTVTLKVQRYPWDSVKYEYKPTETLEELTATTDSAGKAHVQLDTKAQWASDSYYILAQTKDGSGHQVQDSTSIWVSSYQSPFMLGASSAKKEPLTIKCDKRIYRPGETAKIVITGPFTGKDGVEALVSIEGTKLHSIKSQPLTSSAQLIEVPVKAEYAPNFYVSVCLVAKNKQFYSQEQLILVSPENHFLKLAIDTDKERYKPGETVTYKITAKDSAGQPAKGVELSLGLVDESIYSIRPETAQDIKKFFFQQLPNWVTTACSFPEQYSGGPDKLEPRVRKDFKDTAAWQPILVTDQNGTVSTSVKLPDNLTTWRATVRAVSTGIDVGSTINKVISTQDIIARLALPRFYEQGDQGLVSAVVHNYTNKSQKVQLNLSISDELKTGTALNQVLTIAADKAGRFDWPVTASKIGQAKIKLVARGETAADALEQKVAVNPLGIAVSIVQTGLLSKDTDSTDVQFKAADAAAAGTLKRNLSLASSTIGPVLGNFAALIQYPYGCTEQTMSRLMPSIVALKLNKSLHAPLAADDLKKFAEVYKQSMTKLTDYHHQDGGWGWWENDESNAYLTSPVLEGFKLLKEVNYNVDPDLIKTGLAWQDKAIIELTGQLSDAKHKADSYWDTESQADLAYMLYSQSLWKQGMSAANNKAALYLEGQLHALSPEALSYLGRALKAAGQTDRAGRVLDRLIALANFNTTTMDWDTTPALLKKMGRSNDLAYSYRFSPDETTALALNTFVELRPESRESIEKIKAWLLLQQSKEGWSSTKATAQVFKAFLAEELSAQNQANSGGLGNDSFTVSALLGDKPIVSAIAPTPDLTFGPADRLTAGRSMMLAPTSQASTIKLNKSGPGRLYWTACTSYFQDLLKDQATVNQPADLTVDRQFFRLKSKADTASGIIQVKSEPLVGGQVKAGETILMKVTVNTPRMLPYVIVEAALPSGAEVVQSENQKETAEASQNAADQNLQGDWGNAWWTHQDVLDDKIVFFGSHLNAGKSQFYALLRMELPGQVNLNPVMLQGMYCKGVKGFSKLDQLKVSE
jgi:hypothetical protein